MKMFVVSLVVVVATFSSVYAADTYEGSAPVESKCYYGSFMNNDKLEGSSEVACDFHAGWVCETGIYEHGDSTTIVRGCTTEMTCNRNAEENETSCFSKDEGDRHCYFCCDSHLCNNLKAIPEK